MIAELLALDPLGPIPVDLPTLAHFAPGAPIPRSPSLVVHGQAFLAIDLHEKHSVSVENPATEITKVPTSRRVLEWVDSQRTTVTADLFDAHTAETRLTVMLNLFQHPCATD